MLPGTGVSFDSEAFSTGESSVVTGTGVDEEVVDFDRDEPICEADLDSNWERRSEERVSVTIRVRLADRPASTEPDGRLEVAGIED